MNYNRRKFIKNMTVIAGAISVTNAYGTVALNNIETKFPIAFFTKPLDKYEIDFMSETLAESGIDGFDLTVRPRGRVEPERIREDLPAVIEAGKKYGLKTRMMVTAITDASDRFTKQILETAAEMGIKHYRLGYYDYNFKDGIESSLSSIRNEIEHLIQLNKEIGIQGGYQNHSGKRFGAPVWDVWNVIKDLPSNAISSQFDIRHAVTEGSSSWILALHLLKNNIGSLAIKDFIWDVSTGKARVESVPLGEGIVDFDLFFKTIKELNIVAPISLHTEYPLLSKEEENLPLLQKQKIIIATIKKDVDFIRMYLNKYQLV
ncbi:MAG: sugar phosphate isomerase/epimerase family protein [Bacteroidota bacterium]